MCPGTSCIPESAGELIRDAESRLTHYYYTIALRSSKIGIVNKRLGDSSARSIWEINRSEVPTLALHQNHGWTFEKL